MALAQSDGSGGSVSSKAEVTSSEAPYRVAPIARKGLGALATRDLECGELVLAEAPLLCYATDDPAWCDIARSALDDLPKERREQALELHDAFASSKTGEKSIEGILRTNGLSRGQNPGAGGLLCGSMSRFNHDCTPNCDWCWDEEAHEVRVYTATNVPAGTELCIYYGEIRAPRAERRSQLSKLYRFECTCAACSAPAAAVAESDRRRSSMRRILEEIEGLKAAECGKGVRMVCELLDLYDQEGIRLRSFRKRACYFAYQFSLALKDDPGTNWWVRRAFEHSVMCHGLQHEQTRRLRHYVDNPRQHPAAWSSNPFWTITRAVFGFFILYIALSWTFASISAT